MAPTSDNTQGFAVWSSGFSDERGEGVTVCGSVAAGGSASVWLCPRSQGHGAEAAAAAVRGRSPLLGALRQPRQQQRQRGWQEKASKVAAVGNVREEVSDLSAPVLSFHGGYNPLPLLGYCPPALACQGSVGIRERPMSCTAMSMQDTEVMMWHLLPWPVVTEDSSDSWLLTLPEGMKQCPQTPKRSLHCTRRANKDTCRLPAAVSCNRAGLRMSYSSDMCHEPQACSHSPCWDNVLQAKLQGKCIPSIKLFASLSKNSPKINFSLLRGKWLLAFEGVLTTVVTLPGLELYAEHLQTQQCY